LVEGVNLNRFESKVYEKLGCLDERMDGEKRSDLRERFVDICE